MSAAYSHPPAPYASSMPPPPPTFVVVQPPIQPFGAPTMSQYVLPAPMTLWWHEQYPPSGAHSRLDYEPPDRTPTVESPYCEGGGPLFPKHNDTLDIRRAVVVVVVVVIVFVNPLCRHRRLVGTVGTVRIRARASIRTPHPLTRSFKSCRTSAPSVIWRKTDTTQKSQGSKSGEFGEHRRPIVSSRSLAPRFGAFGVLFTSLSVHLFLIMELYRFGTPCTKIKCFFF
ncbi:hypothetical protein GWI33_015831 [Rhynchophorus ferrugineus]|uniref:Uncharacterized protein n=1 Tax=Rhynchophorus ferrugineus TaxID=354439 RepID=A0A834HYG3_RHYFE|nr:hypothetical protein GWI33_015831 [Rhynchophorus ferrugineus]